MPRKKSTQQATPPSHSQVRSLLLQNALTGVPKAAHPQYKPVELNWPTELATLLSNDDNAVILFYKPDCIHCLSFKPVFNDLANLIHESNSQPWNTPIVFAQIDAEKWLKEVNTLIPNFLGDPVTNRGYPTILFKRSDGSNVVWEQDRPPTFDNIVTFMAEFYDEPTLLPITEPLWQVANNDTDPDFLYFYSDNVTLVPRFEAAFPLDEHFSDRSQGMRTASYLIQNIPQLYENALAVPVNLMDRRDIGVPTIYDTRDDSVHAYRDAHAWLKNYLGIGSSGETEEVEEYEEIED